MWKGYLEGMGKLCSGCGSAIWRVWGDCLEGGEVVWIVCGGCLQCVDRLYG